MMYVYLTVKVYIIVW